MARRSIISNSMIKTWISHSNAKARENQANNLIKYNSGLEKETTPVYSLLSVDFNNETRLVKVTIRMTQKYRTIVKYVTRDYVKYPVYSQWNIRQKDTSYNLKLTNSVLENLNNDDNIHIRDFSEEIIVSLNDDSLIPSWLYKKWIMESFNDKSTKNIEAFNKKVRNYNERKVNLNNSLKTAEVLLQGLKKRIKTYNASLIKINEKIAAASKKNWLLISITLFIYYYFKSNYRIRKLKNKSYLINRKIEESNSTIEKTRTSIHRYTNLISEIDISIEKAKEKTQILTDEILEEKNKLISGVTTLESNIDNKTGFVSMSHLSGIEYRQIKGCYVIRNIMNDKTYVGQSKDILKRLKQHFNGTIPKNIIFAEDYYSANDEDKPNLFEVRIIPLDTKDEMDAKEKQLIEEHFAFTTGYNKTTGNS